MLLKTMMTYQLQNEHILCSEGIVSLKAYNKTVKK